MPYVRRSVSSFSESCVERHAVRRDSSGCVEDVMVGSEEDEVVRVVVVRRVSGRPGAEGAPRSVPVCVLLVGLAEAGTMRRDCVGAEGEVSRVAQRIEGVG